MDDDADEDEDEDVREEDGNETWNTDGAITRDFDRKTAERHWIERNVISYSRSQGRPRMPNPRNPV